jgi:GNAT superfamily N-acetyltransferase
MTFDRRGPRIATVRTPSAIDSPDAWPLHGVERVERAAMIADHGDDDDAPTARRRLAALEDQRFTRVVVLVATDPDLAEPSDPADALGFAVVRMPQVANLDTAELDIEVHPDHRRRGIGGALWEASAAVVRHAGRHVVQGWSEHPAEPRPAASRSSVTSGTPTGCGPTANASGARATRCS